MYDDGEFPPEHGTSRQYKRGCRCALCRRVVADQVAAWRAANPDRELTRYLRYFYNLPRERYDAMLAAQQNACAVCRRPFGERGVDKPHIDHDHACCPPGGPNENKPSCGKCVRGLLCRQCNIAIGALGESIEVLEKMADYLRRVTGTPVLGT